VYGRNDRPAQLPQRVEHAIEDLALTQPFFLSHGFTLPQVAADGERPIAGSGDDGDAD
jgi:hypothetical protein